MSLCFLNSRKSKTRSDWLRYWIFRSRHLYFPENFVFFFSVASLKHTSPFLDSYINDFPYQVSRSIGDAYLKSPEFYLDPSFPRFHLAEPIRRPVLTAEPSLYTRALQPNDKFLIFASDGLWEHISNQEAVEIVHKCPRKVCIFLDESLLIFLFSTLCNS